MAYFFITDDNKIYAGGCNAAGHAGVGTTSSSSTNNYALFPPQEIIYTTEDGTVLDGSMVKSITSYPASASGTLLLTNDGKVFVAGGYYVTGLNVSGTNGARKIFTKISVDEDGNEIPPIDKVFIGSSEAFLVTKKGLVYSAGYYNGRADKYKLTYGIISVDNKGNPLPPITDISTFNSFNAFLSKDGEVYTFGKSTSYGVYDDDNIESHVVFYPTKARLKNIKKVAATNYGFMCLDKFGELWFNGYLKIINYAPYSGKYYENSTLAPYLNLHKLSSLGDLTVKYYNDSNTYPLPKKIVDISSFGISPLIKYLDDEGNINVLTTNNAHEYFGGGSFSVSNQYLYNHRGSTGIWDFKNEYEGIYNFDNNAVGTFTKDGKLYVSGSRGTNGTSSNKFTSAIIMPGTEDLTITKVFGTNITDAPILKDELYPMPDTTKSKIKIQNMA